MHKKLNLGSGPNFVYGYINIDKSPNIFLSRFNFIKAALFKFGILSSNQMQNWDKRIIRKDIRKIKFKENSISHIYSSHFFEHIFYWEAVDVLKKCYLFLIPGGIIRIALPDLDAFLNKYQQEIKIDPHKAALDLERSLLSYPLEKPSFLGRIFAQSDHVHKWHPSIGMLKQMLQDIGYCNISEHSFRQGKFQHLDKLESRDDSTFYIEAYKK
jgi:hypothetical protein